MIPGIVVISWIAFALIGVGVVVYMMYAEKKRREAVQHLATDLGLEYYSELSAGDQNQFNDFALAQQGRGRKSSNVIVADSGELRMVIFDYQYTTGSGKSKSTYRQNVVLSQSSSLDMPDFSIAPEGFFHRLANLFGMDDIDFDDDERFSKQFLLNGSNEQTVRDFFDSDRRHKFMEFGQLSVEGRGASFIFYQTRKRWNADEIKTLMEQAYSIYNILGG